MKKIAIRINNIQYNAEVYAPPTGEAILKSLPIKAITKAQKSKFDYFTSPKTLKKGFALSSKRSDKRNPEA